MAGDEQALAALRGLAEALEAPADDEALSRALPLVTRVLRNELRPSPMPPLGEIEPSLGLRYDAMPGLGESGEAGS